MRIWGVNRRAIYCFNMKNRALLFFVVASTLLAGACAAPSMRYTHAGGALGSAAGAAEEPQKGPVVRVLLAEKQRKATFKNTGRVYIYTQDRTQKFKISHAGSFTVQALGAGKIQAGTLQSAQAVILEPATGTPLIFNGNSFAGRVRIVPDGNAFHIVEYAPLEEYLIGVLPYEMSHTWPPEALKAQAVAARTYTLKSMETTGKRYFDLYSDVRSQMYKGSGKKYPSVQKAVQATQGQILTYQNKLFYTYYHGNCGGATDSVTSWNPGSAAIKPLSGAKCGYDKHSKNYAWQMTVPRAKVEAYAASIGLAGKLKAVSVSRKTGTGRATNLTVKTAKGSKNVACGKFRAATGLKSCKINKISVRKKDVLFKGRGSGHGVGMCQDGAYGMAKDGKNYKQILKKYYPGAQLTPLKED